MNKALSNKREVIFLVAPGVLIFFLIILFPILFSVYLGMTDSRGGDLNFVGFLNFKDILFNDPVFYKALMNSLLIGLGYILIQHPFCLLIALILDKIKGRFEKFFRAVFFIPSIISVVVTTRMWTLMYNPQWGVINEFLRFIGLEEYTQAWLGDPNLAFPCVLVMTIWIGFGFGMLLYYAGIKAIPEELYEAAKIDGANTFIMHMKITLPMLTPVIAVNTTLAMINGLKQMEIVYLTTLGGPARATEVVANYLYIEAFRSFKYGYANAISVIFVIVCLIITLIMTKLIRKDIGTA